MIASTVAAVDPSGGGRVSEGIDFETGDGEIRPLILGNLGGGFSHPFWDRRAVWQEGAG